MIKYCIKRTNLKTERNMLRESHWSSFLSFTYSTFSSGRATLYDSPEEARRTINDVAAWTKIGRKHFEICAVKFDIVSADLIVKSASKKLPKAKKEVLLNPLKVRVLQVIKEMLGVDEVKLSSSFVADLGCDSLDLMEVLLAVENEFGLEISDEEAEACLTVQDALNLVKKLKKVQRN